ncbi:MULTISPECIES: hypothetical protein [Rhodococcus]|uniref:Uncharacterized protein n=1 Tax=Rhodococcus opacus RKJ300 = JCM 13270 TaxID=1165867 RepID=I0WNL7_RHOOP|nr:MULTISPECIES: hypothetical protein [Rhodococcus]EID77983.1 hypothetical protein W59_21568 [Rhodococcus opacus RKJ300 = JCM 13270]QQZ16947.1 hypothetical protein GO592_12930 [Rhodococcus sp. 21391]
MVDSLGVVVGALLSVWALPDGAGVVTSGAAEASGVDSTAGTVPDGDAGGDEGTVLLGVTRSAVVSVGVGDVGVVVVVLGVGVGVVVGCAAAIPPPVANNTDANDARINVFAGEARFGRGKFRYFVTLAI